MTNFKFLIASVFACVVWIGGTAQAQQPALRFMPVAPCRVVDTRNPAGSLGGPSIVGLSSRSFAIPSGACNVPPTALAYSLNVTAIPHGFLGYLTIWPTGQTQPLVSTLNSYDGRVKANAAIVPAGSGGAISVYVTDTADVALDINGYFVPASDPSALAFFPLPPCRVVDTRNPAGSLGGPFFLAQQTRSFPILSSSCNIPTTAQAYSLNFTAIPHGVLSFISVWPTGQTQPVVSTLNADTGVVTANAALVPAGSSGAISVFATHDTDLAVDINGYFAPSSSPSDLSLYTLPPCRILDTRESTGLFTGWFTGTILVDTTATPCGVIPAAQSVVLNATVVPPQPLSWIALWPGGQPQPLVSTLNADDGLLTSNMAIVPTTSGAINSFATQPTYLILDTSGYFASGTGPAPTTFVLSVTRTGSGTGIVTSSDGKINCGAVCAVSYVSGTTITLTASAASGFTFAGWSGGGCSGTGTCTVTLSASTAVTASFVNTPAGITLNSASLGKNLQLLVTGALTRTSPTPLTVTITSNDPNSLLVEPVATDPSGTAQGTGSFSATIPAGHGVNDFGFYAGFYIQALASSGTPTITISAPGYQPATAAVTLTPSGFVLNTPNGTGANFTANFPGSDKTLTVTPLQLDGSNNPIGPQALRGGAAVNVNVVSGTPAKGTILGNPAVVSAGGQTSTAVAFHPLQAGTSVISITQPAGFTTPTSGATATATVSSPTISLNPITVGFNQEVTGVGNLGQAPASTLSVTIASNNANVLLSTNAALVGTNSVTLSVAAGTTALPAFYVQGAGAVGTTAVLTATATNYSPGTANVTVAGSAFIFLSGNQQAGNFSTTTISGATTLTVGFWQLDSLSRPLSQGIMRPGQSASVGVTSGNPGAGTISGSPVNFIAGSSIISTMTFLPVPTCTTPCTTTLSVNQPAGYSAPVSGGSVTATVNKPRLTLLAVAPTVGQNLESQGSGSMDATNSGDNLWVTISSSNPNVLLAQAVCSGSPAVCTPAIAPGGPTVQFGVPGSGGSVLVRDYYIQSLVGSGTATLTATVQKLLPDSSLVDAGYDVTPVTVNLAPAGFVLIDPNNNVGGTYPASANSSVNLTVAAVILGANSAPTGIYQPLRGGLSASLTVTSNNPNISASTPVGIAAGTISGQTIVTVPIATNGQSAVISISTPSGFSTASTGGQLTIAVQ